ncbi:unnamed protein product [Linum trigynum]|uniref:Uncharacterized protein n=1 Tax=Linum trigynum TaxID=586398 RepID=A0AAV2CY01_9ROSI
MTNAQKLLITSTRSLSVSFQGESFVLQVSKTKPAPSPVSARKGTPEQLCRYSNELGRNACNHDDESLADGIIKEIKQYKGQQVKKGAPVNQAQTERTTPN